MVNLHEVKSAQVNLQIGDKDVNLRWSKNDLRDLRRNQVNIDGNVDMENAEELNGAVAGDEDIDDDERNGNSDFPDPFLPDGKWNPQHIRKIVHVLDNYHISHDAYTELRLTSRSILPPLLQVKQEKNKMSKGINYYKCGTVSLVFILN